MPKTEAQKRAQKKFMQKGTWKRFSNLMRVEDIDHIKSIAAARGIPSVTLVKQAISAYTGETFTWDEPPKSDKSAD